MRPAIGNSKNDMTEGNITSILFFKTLPMLISLLGIMTFNLADAFFVGKLGKSQLAALAMTFPVTMTINSLALGLSMGLSIIMARLFGSDGKKALQQMLFDSFVLSFLMVAVIIVIGLATIDPLFRKMGANANLLPMIKEYMVVWYIGAFFVIIPMVANGALRGLGDTNTPSLFMMIAVLTNIGLDPILIFGLGPIDAMGIRGAAIATVFARGITFAAVILVLIFRYRLLRINQQLNRKSVRNWGELLHLGLPAAASRLILPLGLGTITSLCTRFGEEAVAAYGVGSKIEMFAIAPVMALSSILAPFIGQNRGAGMMDRINSGIKHGIIFAFLNSIIVVIIVQLFGMHIAGSFSTDILVQEGASRYLYILTPVLGCHGSTVLFTASANAINRPLTGTAFTVFEMFVCAVPAALIGSLYLGLTGLFTGMALAYVAAFALVSTYFVTFLFRKGKLSLES